MWPDVIALYKKLPEANAIPESLRDYQRAMDRIAEKEAELAEMYREWIDSRHKVIADLRKDWTDRELAEAGLSVLTFVPHCGCGNPSYETVVSRIDALETCKDCGKERL